MKTIVVGTRDSELALVQTYYVIDELKKRHPGHRFEVRKIKTEGDKILDVTLAKIGDKGLFVKEIEHALLAGEIDFAVHSMKDVPTDVPPGLVIAAVTRREDPRDCYIAKDGVTPLKAAPRGAVIGTSSLRRRAQLLHFRPDLRIVPLRGNLNTRFHKLREQDMDGIVLARAGVLRLGWEGRITEVLDFSICLPAVGQGALGVEARQDDAEILGILACLNDPPTAAAVAAERAFLSRLEGGCQVPVGAYGRLESGVLVLSGVVAGTDGSVLLKGELSGAPSQAEKLGLELAEKLLAKGADHILSTVRQGIESHE